MPDVIDPNLKSDEEMTDVEKDRVVSARKFALSTALNSPNHVWHANPYAKAEEIVEYVLRGTIPDSEPEPDYHGHD